MVRAWRIVAARWADAAFDGEGARRYGGRWNSPGRPAIYLAGTRALAALETLVHLSPGVAARQQFIRFEVGIPKSLVSRLDWDQGAFEPFVGAETQAAGDRWLGAARRLALRVPSAVIPEEENYLLNPAHPRFNEVEISDGQAFAFDPRLLEKQ
ncbi:MAG TPA: RES family NAD+ phosphorylase [Opitutales bacterium]|nr:RES family NAD+ phosphorylase [Opitutales bacterium]